MNVWCLSDLHLKSDQDPRSQVFVHFLQGLYESSEPRDILILLGDVFDLWVGGHSVFYNKYKKIVDAIQALKNKGLRIIFIEGNHDLHIAPFWESQLGAEVYVEAYYLELPDLILRLEHGDMINLEDHAYLRLRAFLRHPIMKFLGIHLPGFFWNFIGTQASHTSRKVSTQNRKAQGQNEKMIEMIRHHAQRAYLEKPFQMIISGHMHVIDDFKFEKPDLRSINLGSWMQTPYLVFHLEKKDGHFWTTEWVRLQ